jgi:hypothetical protein
MNILMLSPTPISPQNFGNRVRIERVVRSFKDRGHKVDFLFYPAEHDWRFNIPEVSMKEMNALVENFFISPPSIPIHSPSLKEDHDIDEWWDESLASYIKWLFSLKTYDIFFVNYTWLSKALELAPKTTFKVLDTHDIFSNRRQMLEGIGIAAEFFHTTISDEVKGLKRADLVLAIKEEEELLFRKRNIENTNTLIHSDEPRYLTLNKTPNFFKFGIFAAKNNLNNVNIRNFIKDINPIVKKFLYPFEIHIYGSICKELEDLQSTFPYIKLIGYVEKQKDFYVNVDCVLIPMSASTGLKIKAAEALSYGVPVISHAHAFEGLPSMHQFHRLNTFEAMGEAMLNFVYYEDIRISLTYASKKSHAISWVSFNGSIDRIIDKRSFSLPKTVCLIDHSSIASIDDIFQLRDLIRYVSYKFNVGILIYNQGKYIDKLMELLNENDRPLFVIEDINSNKNDFYLKWLQSAELIILNSAELISKVHLSAKTIILDARSKNIEKKQINEFKNINKLILLTDSAYYDLDLMFDLNNNEIIETVFLTKFFWKFYNTNEKLIMNYETLIQSKISFPSLSEEEINLSVLNDSGWAKLWSILSFINF